MATWTNRLFFLQTKNAHTVDSSILKLTVMTANTLSINSNSLYLMEFVILVKEKMVDNNFWTFNEFLDMCIYAEHPGLGISRVCSFIYFEV